MASLSLYTQFEINLMSNRKVIELPLQLKSANAHGKNNTKSDLPSSAIFSVIVHLRLVICLQYSEIKQALQTHFLRVHTIVRSMEASSKAFLLFSCSLIG